MWVFLSLFTALSLSFSDAFLKLGSKDSSPLFLTAGRLFYALLIIIPFAVIVNEKIWPEKGYWLVFFSALPIEMLATFLYVKAIKVSPLSLTLPFLSLTPVFLTVIPKILLGEGLSYPGLMGVFSIAIGGYLLNFDRSVQSIMDPFYAIGREKGSLYMIIVAILYAVTSTLGKKAITLSSPAYFACTYFIALAVSFNLICRLFCKDSPKKKNKYIFVSGLLYGIMIISHMYAISITKVAYMISLKRFSLIFGILLGYIFFKEKNLKSHLLGGSFMLAGFVMITLFG